jgi:hypothetical protein
MVKEAKEAEELRTMLTSLKLNRNIGSENSHSLLA